MKEEYSVRDLIFDKIKDIYQEELKGPSLKSLEEKKKLYEGKLINTQNWIQQAIVIKKAQNLQKKQQNAVYFSEDLFYKQKMEKVDEKNRQFKGISLFLDPDYRERIMLRTSAEFQDKLKYIEELDTKLSKQLVKRKKTGVTVKEDGKESPQNKLMKRETSKRTVIAVTQRRALSSPYSEKKSVHQSSDYKLKTHQARSLSKDAYKDTKPNEYQESKIFSMTENRSNINSESKIMSSYKKIDYVLQDSELRLKSYSKDKKEDPNKTLMEKKDSSMLKESIDGQIKHFESQKSELRTSSTSCNSIHHQSNSFYGYANKKQLLDNKSSENLSKIEKNNKQKNAGMMRKIENRCFSHIIKNMDEKLKKSKGVSINLNRANEGNQLTHGEIYNTENQTSFAANFFYPTKKTMFTDFKMTPHIQSSSILPSSDLDKSSKTFNQDSIASKLFQRI